MIDYRAYGIPGQKLLPRVVRVEPRIVEDDDYVAVGNKRQLLLED